MNPEPEPIPTDRGESSSKPHMFESRESEIEDAGEIDVELVALLDVALARAGGSPPPLSSELAARIAVEAEAHLPRSIRPQRTPRPLQFAAWSGWITAVAASIALMFTLSRPLPTIDPRPPIEPTRPKTLPEPSLAERMAALRGQSSRTVELRATESPLARGASGEIVWSADRRTGFLRVEGLAAVEPERGVYQLWIFDRRRDERYPVDGGLFRVDDAGKPTIISIHPALDVAEPTLFAITLEPPGGVVVSDRKRILLAGNLDP